MRILHVAAVDLLPNSGMGRISCEWNAAFLRAGHEFQHIGLKEIGPSVHPLLFGLAARNFINRNKIAFDLILAHEPASGFLYFRNSPMVVFSHGIEERAWKIQGHFGFMKRSLKSRLVPEAIRFYSNTSGFRRCSVALLSNSDDLAFLADEKGIAKDKLRIFYNGYYPFDEVKGDNAAITFLYNATWIPRKGIDLMYTVFNKLLIKHDTIKLILAGTGASSGEVLSRFHEEVRGRINVISSFSPDQERRFYRDAQVFIMPSFFEGQSVALTQAMAMGLCPVVSDNCGQKDFVKHQHNGLQFKTGDAADMEKEIDWLLQNPDRIILMGKNAKESVRHLTWERAASEVVLTCESVF
jgi:glycosyltransferase involved in cell wall biosynthesis